MNEPPPPPPPSPNVQAQAQAQRRLPPGKTRVSDLTGDQLKSIIMNAVLGAGLFLLLGMFVLGFVIGSMGLLR